MQTVNGLDCKWIGRRPVLQTVINNSRCRAKADGIAQTSPPTPTPSLCRNTLDKLHECPLCDEYKP